VVKLNAGASPFFYDPEAPLPPSLLAAALAAPRAFAGAVRFIVEAFGAVDSGTVL